MANSKNSGSRTRFNYITGKEEQVPGTKAGKKRMRLSVGDPLRTHDLRRLPPKTKAKMYIDRTDSD